MEAINIRWPTNPTTSAAVGRPLTRLPKGPSPGTTNTKRCPISSDKPVFQALTLLQNGQLSPEQIQYAYNKIRMLRATAFAQTPAVCFTPTSGQSWYSGSENISLAAVRARNWYAYDSGGRMVSDQTFWDTASGTSYTSALVLG